MFDRTLRWSYDESPDLWLPEAKLPDYCKKPSFYSAMWPKMQTEWRTNMTDPTYAEERERAAARAGANAEGGDAGKVVGETVDALHRTAPAAGADAHALLVGARVQARYNFPAWEEYFRGTVEAINEDGTLAIRYDNGYQESHVLRAAVMDLPEGVDPAVLPAAGPDPPALRRRWWWAHWYSGSPWTSAATRGTAARIAFWTRCCHS